MRFPLQDQGDIAVVCNVYPEAEYWQFLIDAATAGKRAFESRKLDDSPVSTAPRQDANG